MSDFFYMLSEKQIRDERRSAERIDHQEKRVMVPRCQVIKESQFSPKSFPHHPQASSRPVMSYEEVEQLLKEL